MMLIPGVTSVKCGETFVPEGSPDRSRGWNYCIKVGLIDKEALIRYAEHPLHLSVKKNNIGPLLERGPSEDVMAVDWVDEGEAVGGGGGGVWLKVLVVASVAAVLGVGVGKRMKVR
jgi:hypothetical protein